jgi:hypothetical protein
VISNQKLRSKTGQDRPSGNSKGENGNDEFDTLKKGKEIIKRDALNWKPQGNRRRKKD